MPDADDDGLPATHPHGRPPRRIPLGLLLTLAVLLVLGVVTLLALDRRDAPEVATGPGELLPASELAGEWSGDGSLTRCAGLEDEDCSGTRPIALTIACRSDVCTVTPVDRRYGTPPLRFEDGAYRAAGPVPPDVAPRCGGVPTRSALWRLELTARDGRLVGSFAESTVQGFDCGATGSAWEVALERD